MSSPKTFDIKKSIRTAKLNGGIKSKWSFEVSGDKYAWTTKMDRINVIRNRLPYEAIEVISNKANLPIKHFLRLLDIPQTTYNKKKKAHELLSSKDSELILVLVELLEYGIDVFNNEKSKFYRWLKKANPSLGDASPESLFDSLTGIQEVKNSLNRLEYGNLS